MCCILSNSPKKNVMIICIVSAPTLAHKTVYTHSLHMFVENKNKKLHSTGVFNPAESVVITDVALSIIVLQDQKECNGWKWISRAGSYYDKTEEKIVWDATKWFVA